MDIRSIETSANRVLAYVTEVQNSTSKMYKPTKVRLQKLREVCLQCADIIAEVTEMPDTSSSSGSESSHEDLLNKIRDLVEVASWSAIEHHIERQTVVTSDMKPADTDETPVDCCSTETKTSKTDKSKITKNDRKHAIRAYANALREGAEQTETPPSDTDRCASLIWLWYSSRFLKSRNPNFHYDVGSIPEFIKSLVIAFSIHQQNGTLEKFISSVEKWCDDICTDQHMVWALPFSVNEIHKNGIYQVDTNTNRIWFDLYFSRWRQLHADTKLKWPLGTINTRVFISA